jgi:tetratricopeptide (TPR) repeat protein
MMRAVRRTGSKGVPVSNLRLLQLGAAVLVPFLCGAPAAAQSPASRPTARPSALEATAARIDTLIRWSGDGFVAPDPEFAAARRKPAESRPAEPDRGALMDQALTWAQQEQRLVLWYVPRIEGPHMYRSALLDGYMREVYWSDPAIAALVNEMFVPVRMKSTRNVLGERFGITALEYVEPAIVLLKPNGEVHRVLDRIRTFNPDWLRDWLLQALRSAPDLNHLPANIDEHPSARLGRIFDCGHYDLLRRMCENDVKVGAAGVRVMSELYLGAVATFERDAAAAEAHFANAAAAADGSRETTEALKILPAARCHLRLRQGRHAEAIEDLRAASRVLSQDGKLAGQAEYLEGFCLLELKRSDEAIAIWKELCSKHPESVWAARAALALLPSTDTTPASAARHGYLSFEWQPAETYGGASRNTHGRLGGTNGLERAQLAVRWLLDHQDPSGGWRDSRYAYWESPKILPNVWMAVTALSAAALLEWRGLASAEIDRALAEAEGYILDDTLVAGGTNEQCYAEAYRLLFLAKRLGTMGGGKDRVPLVKKMNAIVERLEKLQAEHGAFAHEYANPFTTAAVMQCLAMARKAGALVPDSLMQKGARALLAVRDAQSGTFAYANAADAQAPVPPTDSKDAMARMPVCESALLLAQRGDPKALDAALENWWSQLERFDKIRTCDFHSDGQLGGFFFWHAFYHTSEATKQLDERGRSHAAGRFLDHLLRIQEMDGTFIDSHELGKSYGTAMGLLSLKNCIGEP